MALLRLASLTCDGIRKGRGGIAGLHTCKQEILAPHNETTVKIRAAAASKFGWEYIGKRDYCPRCAARQDQPETKKAKRK